SSAYRNLKYQKNLWGDKVTDIKELLTLVGLADSRKPVRNYSLGMKQRLGLAMALVGNPDFLILDEPLNGLDPDGIRDMRSLIIELNQKYGKTILISSHILGELQKIATYYGFLKNGKLIREFSNDVLKTDLETFYFENFA
ncbi:MAG: ATP-binding cassette domain-containing protein, partial [Bacillota bacterium]|nr:ATP-binding cassette domain-containing protein [Bacillota bacterium]